MGPVCLFILFSLWFEEPVCTWLYAYLRLHAVMLLYKYNFFCEFVCLIFSCLAMLSSS